jgi:hypothetical protein
MALFAISVFALPATTGAIEFDYCDYPRLRSVQNGCEPATVEHCIVIIPGAGSANEVNWRDDIDILTKHLPRSWGFLALRPEPGSLLYTERDIAHAIGMVQRLARDFNAHSLHMVQLSDGARVGREVQVAAVLPARMGLIAELDPRVVAIPSLSSDYLAYVTYWRQYSGLPGPHIPTGPKAFSIQLSPSLDHSEILGGYRDEVNVLLQAIAREDQSELLRLANSQMIRLSDWFHIDLVGHWKGTVSWTCGQGESGSLVMSFNIEDHNPAYRGGAMTPGGIFWPEYKFYVGTVDYPDETLIPIYQAANFPIGADIYGNGAEISDGLDVVVYHSAQRPYVTQNFKGRIVDADTITGTSLVGDPTGACNLSQPVSLTFTVVRQKPEPQERRPIRCR